MQRLMTEIKRRMSHLRNDTEPDELRLRKCMGKTILLMKNLRETFVESGKYGELVGNDASNSLQKCRRHMGLLYGIVPCNDGGGKVSQEVLRVFHQHMDAVLVELGHFMRDPPKKHKSPDPDGRDEVRMKLQLINYKLMLLGDRTEAAEQRLDTGRGRARKLHSELSQSQVTLQMDLDAAQNDGGDAINQCSPKWSDLITRLSGKMKNQSPRQISEGNIKWRQLSESCLNLTEKRSHMNVRDPPQMESKVAGPGPIWGHESKTCLSNETWPDLEDSGTVTQTRSTSSDSLFRSEATTTTPPVSVRTLSGKMKTTSQSPRQIPHCKVSRRQLSESCLNLTEVRDERTHKNPPQSETKVQNNEYQDFLAEIYKPIVHKSTASLDPLRLSKVTHRSPVSVAIQTSRKKTSLPPVSLRPKRSQSTTSHYSLGKTFGDKRLSLLRWCKERTRPYGLPMYEFCDSWTSGRALVALMHSYHKELIDFRFLSKESPRDTLTYGAEVAKSLGVNCGVDIVQECLQKKPNFCMVFKFVKELRRCLDQYQKNNTFF